MKNIAQLKQKSMQTIWPKCLIGIQIIGGRLNKNWTKTKKVTT